jgi:SAM-dependent methyltransferase
MTKNYYLNPDVLIRLIQRAWIFSNPRLRTHVELDESSMKQFIEVAGMKSMPEEYWMERLSQARGKDRTERGLGRNGLHADHSCFAIESTAPWVEGVQFFELLKKKSLLISSEAEAYDKLKPLTGLLDRENIGTFHQRVGQYLLLEKRVKDSWREWHNQKFSNDGKSLLDSPYKVVQEPFFDKYFSKERIQNFKILDFGCGNAYYTAKFADHASKVFGLDNSKELLEIAKTNYGHRQNLDLILTQSFEEVLNLMNSWEAGSFDLVYLQDTLLLLMQPEFEAASKLLPDLLAGFRRLLKSTGTLCAMEPQPSFWLANRYGDRSHPYAIVTEYKNPVFNVAPTLESLMKIVGPSGFALKELKNPTPDQDLACGKYNYQSEFPIWDFFVFMPI